MRPALSSAAAVGPTRRRGRSAPHRFLFRPIRANPEAAAVAAPATAEPDHGASKPWRTVGRALTPHPPALPTTATSDPRPHRGSLSARATACGTQGLIRRSRPTCRACIHSSSPDPREPRVRKGPSPCLAKGRARAKPAAAARVRPRANPPTPKHRIARSSGSDPRLLNQPKGANTAQEQSRRGAMNDRILHSPPGHSKGKPSRQRHRRRLTRIGHWPGTGGGAIWSSRWREGPRGSCAVLRETATQANGRPT